MTLYFSVVYSIIEGIKNHAGRVLTGSHRESGTADGEHQVETASFLTPVHAGLCCQSSEAHTQHPVTHTHTSTHRLTLDLAKSGGFQLRSRGVRVRTQ